MRRGEPETVGWDERATDPLLLAYANRIVKTPGPNAPSVTTPRQVVGEQRATAISIVRGRRGAEQATPKEREPLARAVWDAVPVLWFSDIVAVALASALPRHIVGAFHLAHPNMYWSFEDALPEKDNGETVGLLDAVFMSEHAHGIEIATFSARNGDAVIRGQILRFGSRYPEDVGLGARQLLQLAAFMNSPFIALEKRWTHQAGAKVRFHGRRIGDPMAIHVVALRSEIKEAVAVERGDGPAWKQRWLVRGHYRAQWYASTRTHKVIWIAPYIKGPDGAELKIPVYAVVR